ncbi:MULTISPECIES: hypothetical protein [unclassified Cryobacterium]|uniref:hypothetical protein n=1 Tax=unclassified Cryobacterium TaxID=2649013 RepID=UPI001447CAC9|nr:MULTISPECIES: hypothetical protein [unclassified Cryobacterium]
MRWDNLFDDLESQLEHELAAEEVDLKGEEERLRIGRLALRDRLLAIHDASGGDPYLLRLVLTDGRTIAVRPRSFGKDWLTAELVDDARQQTQCVIPLWAVASIVVDRAQVDQSLIEPVGGTPVLSGRLSLTFVLRDLARRRCSLELQVGAAVIHGTIDRVGRDHFDVAVHEPGSARRERDVLQYRLVPLHQLLLVRL